MLLPWSAMGILGQCCVCVTLLLPWVGLHSPLVSCAQPPAAFCFCSVLLMQTPSASVVVPALFHLCQKAVQGSTHLLHLGVQGLQEEGQAHLVLWAVLLGAGSAEKCVFCGRK